MRDLPPAPLLRPALAMAHAPSCAHDGIAEWQAQLPNALTLARVLAIPPFVAAFCSPRAARLRVPAALFAAMSFTDFVDGYLARRWGVQSEFGAFLDPVADKLLVCTSLTLLSATLGICVALPAVVIVCREIAVSGLRECASPPGSASTRVAAKIIRHRRSSDRLLACVGRWMASKGTRSSVAVGWPGKLKTATQMAALQVLLLCSAGADGALLGLPLGLPTVRFGVGLLYVSAVLTIVSGAQLARQAVAALRSL